MHIRISLGTKFLLKMTILSFWTKFAQKKVFPVKNGKCEHHHSIVHIRIGLDKEVLYLRWNEHHLSAYFGTPMTQL